MMNWCRNILVVMSLYLMSVAAIAAGSLGPTIQIYTQFKYFVGNPTWLLIIRDVDTQLVVPYVYEIKNNENYWIALTYGHHYQITASQLKFGTYAEINNFCGLEDGVLSGVSMYMTLTGVLTPDAKTSHCYVRRYKNPF